MKLLETEAAQAAATAWLEGDGIRGALARYGLELEDVGAWGFAGEQACLAVASDHKRFMGRFVGAIAAAIVLGIELERNGEVPG